MGVLPARRETQDAEEHPGVVGKPALMSNSGLEAVTGR